MLGGDRGANNCSTGLEPPNKKLSGKHYSKNGSKPIYRLYEQKTESVDLLASCCSILKPIEYKERQNKIGHYIHWKISGVSDKSTKGQGSMMHKALHSRIRDYMYQDKKKEEELPAFTIAKIYQ